MDKQVNLDAVIAAVRDYELKTPVPVGDWAGMLLEAVKADLLEDIGELETMEIVRCEECKYYRRSSVEDRRMCFRKDVDGMPVCYDFAPDDWCRYGERKD